MNSIYKVESFKIYYLMYYLIILNTIINCNFIFVIDIINFNFKIFNYLKGIEYYFMLLVCFIIYVIKYVVKVLVKEVII